MTSRRGPAKVVSILASCAAMLALASCADEKTTSLPTARVAGTWETSSGGRITLREDKTFDVSNVKWDSSWNDSCPAGEAKGTWGFWVDEGKPGGTIFISDEANSGSGLGLQFADVPAEGCYLTLNVVDGGDTLCAADDPDTVCGLDIRFSRTKAHAEQSGTPE